MCGILGTTRKIDLKKPSRAIKTRGPNGSGKFKNKYLQLAHSRLSIIDLSSKGKQPMCNEDGTIWVVCNGEIYNHQKLRDKLREEHKFKSKTDTEIILHLYEEQGIDFIKQLNGMFAFALYDSNIKKLFLVRDRFGIKPLYFSTYKGFTFASTLNALLESGIPKNLNEKAIIHHMCFRRPHTNASIFSHIQTLKPGGLLTYDFKTKDIDIQIYYNVLLLRNKKSNRRAIELVEKKLLESVKKRMISDVPVGAYLSGGLDSSLLVAMMKKFKKNFHTYSVKMEDYDETQWAKKVAKHVGVKHHVVNVTQKEYMKAMEELIKKTKMPLSVPNEPLIYLMSKELKKDMTVVLSGEGADELFGGYDRIFSIQDVPNSKRPEEFANRYNYFKSIKKVFEKSKLFCNILSFKEGIMRVFQKYHIQSLLNRLDNATMNVPVEGRVPFMDHELINYAFLLPYDVKIKNSNPKWVLKQVAYKYLPSDVVDRKKVGFPVPLKNMFKNKERINKMVFSEDSKVKLILDKRTLARIQRKNDPWEMWMMFNIETWLRCLE